MIEIVSLITPFAIVFVSALVCIVKTCKDTMVEERLNSNKFVHRPTININEISLGSPPNKGSNVQPSANAAKLTNCKNCGAPLHGSKCKFCDTEYD